MMGRILALVVPASVLATLLVVFGGLRHRGTISDATWLWLWPTIVLFLYLAIGVGLLLIRARKWAIPPFVGFGVHLVGLLLMLFEVLDPWDVLWYSLGAFFLALFLLLAIWGVATIRARWLERTMVQGMAGDGVDAQALERVRKDMLEALGMLRKAGRGRNAVYELPWFLVMGRPQAGKTVAIKNSGLSLPVRKDWVKGVGGTFTADWFFTNEMIFLDTPGKWVVEGASEEGSQHWKHLLNLLRKYRGRRPLDGLVVVVPADDLLSKTRDELVEQAANVREVIDLIHDELKFRFPVYLLVSKTDLVEGFVDFFKGLPANRKHQVFGWSHPDPNDRGAVGALRKGFRRVLRRMEAYRLEILARTASRTTARRLFFFTEEFRRIENPLVEFAESLFQDDPYHEAPVFRGFYFTSGTQGEGAPLGQAMAQMARNLGIRTAGAGPAAEEEPKRSYFLLELFRELMVGDEGLVSRTARHWWRRRRDTVLAAFLPAALAGLFLLFSFVAFLMNQATYRAAGNRVPEIARELESLPSETSVYFPEALQKIDEIRRFHRKMRGFALVRGFGWVRRPGPLADNTFRIFREALETKVVIPTLSEAERFVTEGEASCTDRADVFYAVVWLARGERAESAGDLRGLGKIWSLSAEEVERVRDLLVDQFSYLRRNAPGNQPLLPGVSLPNMARALRQACGAEGAGSALEAFQSFQRECLQPQGVVAVERCDQRLKGVLAFEQEDYERLRRQLDSLKTDLKKIGGRESGAAEAIEDVAAIRLADARRNECYAEFERSVVPLIEGYLARQRDIVEQCKSAYRASGTPMTVANELEKQRKEREAQRVALDDKFREFSRKCEAALVGVSLQASAVTSVDERFIRQECLGEKAAPAPAPAAAPRPRAAGGGASVPTSAPAARVSRWTHLEVPGAPGGYGVDALSRQIAEWRERSTFYETDPTLTPPERARALGGLARDVGAYASGFRDAWKRYLRGVRPRGGGGVVSAWLADLAQSQEFRRAIDPAVRAVDAASRGTEPWLAALADEVRGLESLVRFVDSGLPVYQGKLRRIAEDLKRCESDQAALQSFRSGLRAGSRENALVDAYDWVQQNAESGLAEGALTALFREPLDRARSYLESPDLMLRQWTELAALSSRIHGKFPFGGASATELVSIDDMVALLGGRSGYANVLGGQAGSLPLSPAAARWLKGAADLSPIFFPKGEDEPRRYELTLVLEEPVFEPEDAAKDTRLQGVRLTGLGAEVFSWTVAQGEEGKQKRVALDLFGADKSGASELSVVLGDKKFMAFIRPGEFKDVPLPPVSANGAWAPLRLLSGGLEKGASPSGDQVMLSFRIPFDHKKKGDGTAIVRFRASGERIGRLLGLVRDGIEPAPSSFE